MRIEFLKLRNFRNYREFEIEFNNHVNIFYGQNGVGKTNLLEAIDFCLTGKSFRSAHNDNLIKHAIELPVAKINAVLDKKNIKKNIDIQISEAKKEVRINSKKVPTQSLRRHATSVLFSPESLSILKQGPAERRSLIDEIAISFNPENSKLIHEYNKILKTKNRVLKNYADGLNHKAETELLLESINPNFLILASELVFLRLKIIKMMSPRIKEALFSLLGEVLVDILVDYVISGKSAIDWSQNQVYDALKLRLENLHDAELGAAMCLVGPHKHDVQFLFNGQNARTFCSQGQQRSIVLAVKIAQIIKYSELHGEYPVLLLDDVFSELDSERRESLMKILNNSRAQIFVTMTELDEKIKFCHEEVKFFEMSRESTR